MKKYRLLALAAFAVSRPCMAQDAPAMPRPCGNGQTRERGNEGGPSFPR